LAGDRAHGRGCPAHRGFRDGQEFGRRGDRLPLEQRGEPYALLDLDYLSWAGTGDGDRAAEFGLLRQNLAAVAANYRQAGIRRFVLAFLGWR
jgi:hypothetical protein